MQNFWQRLKSIFSHWGTTLDFVIHQFDSDTTLLSSFLLLISSLSLVFIFFILFLFLFWDKIVTIRSYSWLCTQILLLVVLRGPFRRLEIKSGSADCKANILPTVLSHSLFLSHCFTFSLTLFYFFFEALKTTGQTHLPNFPYASKIAFAVVNLGFYPVVTHVTITVLCKNWILTWDKFL